MHALGGPSIAKDEAARLALAIVDQWGKGSMPRHRPG
jgi:hypothetical protein